MKCRVGVVCSLAVTFAVLGLTDSTAVAATDLPAIKAAARNKVPECATPGRLMSYLGQRNASINAKFSNIATEYMRHGEEMEIRWDYAFFQMMLETGNLSYQGSNRAADVKPSQNNFAGLGAVGNGEPGESFRDVSTGVRAHLQHLMMYSGQRIEAPVAERTRKVQEWGILTSWQKGFKRPITFTDLARKWAPGTGEYAGQIQTIATGFYNGACKQADPDPDRIAEARGIKTSPRAKIAATDSEPAKPGEDIARNAIEQARKEGPQRFALGAAKATKQSGLPATPEATPAQQAAVGSVPFKLINPPQAEPQPPAESLPQARTEPPSPPPATKGAAASPAAKPPARADATKCRVWTASYGGARAVIIKAVAEQTVNYTVLDVNEGQERREATAFISAYAKNGVIAHEFASQSQALDRAFELCPEG